MNDIGFVQNRLLDEPLNVICIALDFPGHRELARGHFQLFFRATFPGKTCQEYGS